MAGSYILTPAPQTTVRLIGIANSPSTTQRTVVTVPFSPDPFGTPIPLPVGVVTSAPGPTQRIVIAPNGGDPSSQLTVPGGQLNHVAGRYTVDSADGVTQITISMSYDNLGGSGFQDSAVAGVTSPVSPTSGFAVVSGSNSGDSGQINTIVFAYWQQS